MTLLLRSAGVVLLSAAIAASPAIAQADPYAASPSAFEHADSGRTSRFEGVKAFPTADGPPLVGNGELPGAWGAVTGPGGEAFVLWGVIGGVPAAKGAVVSRVDPVTLKEIWRSRLPLPDAPNLWNYPGALAVHGNGHVYVAYATRIAKLDPATGAVLAVADLPAPNGRADSTYNGFVVLSDGRILAKSHHRHRNCPVQGYRAFIECGVKGLPASALVILEPDTLRPVWSGAAPELIGGRVTAVTWRGQEFVYLAGDTYVHRMRYAAGRLEPDSSWGPVRYRSEEQTPGTAAVAFGDFVVIQNNAIPTRAPMTLTAISQASDKVIFTVRPFDVPVAGWSYMPSKVTTDWEQRRVYTATAYDGMAALDFDPKQGFSVAWRAPQPTGSFISLLVDGDRRVLVSSSVESPRPDELGAPQHETEDAVWRRASDGAELARISGLPRNLGLTIVPDRKDGVFYATRAKGLLRLSPRSAVERSQ